VPEDAIKITFSGVRLSGKLYEEPYFDEEQTFPSSQPKFQAAYYPPFPVEEVLASLYRLLAVIHNEPDAVRKVLKELPPEFQASLLAGDNGPSSQASRKSTNGRTSERLASVFRSAFAICAVAREFRPFDMDHTCRPNAEVSAIPYGRVPPI
jgi:hypothetical protein